MRIVILYIILLSSSLAFSQKENEIKKELKKIIKSTSKQEFNKTWYACNKNSAFYKLDTVVFCTSVNYLYHSNCCNYLEWNFKNIKNLFFSKTNICKEPPPSLVSSDESNFKLKIKTKNGTNILKIKNHRGVYFFKIISISRKEIWENGEKAYFIKLVKTE